MKHFIRDTFVLLVITLVSGVLLGFFNELTQASIAEYEEEKKTSACSGVFYEADENGELVSVTELIFKPLSDAEIAELNAALIKKEYENLIIEEVYLAYTSDGQTEDASIDPEGDSAAELGTVVDEEHFYGYVFGVKTKEGYNGEISFYVGITVEGRLKGVSLLSIAETPGLGMNAERVLLPQFRDVKADIFYVVKTPAQMPNEIDAISGATITSEAITEGVNASYECFVILQEEEDVL